MAKVIAVITVWQQRKKKGAAYLQGICQPSQNKHLK